MERNPAPPSPAVANASRRSLYPDHQPFTAGWLPPGAPHEIYYEECGKPNGKPAVILHGGPGGAINPTMRRFFDPAKWRMALFDQRGCGRSRPHAVLEDNDTWKLIADIERLRERCGVEKWTVFGGSWGSTLALAYAIAHPDRVDALILRGVFLLTRRELLWFYQDGASMVFPDAWERYLAPIPVAERGDMMGAYYKRPPGADPDDSLECAVPSAALEGD